MTDDEETVCLEKGQVVNIVKAARGDKDACPKAKQFIKDLLPDQNKKKSKKRKHKKDKDEYLSLEIAEKYGKKFINRLLNRW